MVILNRYHMFHILVVVVPDLFAHRTESSMYNDFGTVRYVMQQNC